LSSYKSSTKSKGTFNKRISERAENISPILHPLRTVDSTQAYNSFMSLSFF